MDPFLLRLALAMVVVLLATLVGRVWQRRDGRVEVAGDIGRDHRAALGLTVDHGGPQAVLFGSSTCAPCDTVKGLLREVEEQRGDFRWQYVDAADRMDLVDAHRIRRVPTLLLLDERGEIVARSSGVPERSALAEALSTPLHRAV